MIGERLKRIRKDKKINQGELAAVLGVSKSAISLYETDRNDPSDKKKKEIAKFLNVSLDYLLGLIEEPVPYYSDETFLRLPDDITAVERTQLLICLEFILYKRNN